MKRETGATSETRRTTEYAGYGDKQDERERATLADWIFEWSKNHHEPAGNRANGRDKGDAKGDKGVSEKGGMDDCSRFWVFGTSNPEL